MVCAVIENQSSVFEIEEIAHLTNLLQTNDNTKKEIQKRKNRIADHVRALCFLIPEGAPLPGRSGRARIIRTLIRGLLTDLYTLDLNSSEKIKQLISEIILTYQFRYPNLHGKEKQIFKMILDHEKIYLKSLNKAKNAIMRYLEKNNKNQLDETEKEFFRKQFGIPFELQERYINL